jgi:hypothetical protein
VAGDKDIKRLNTADDGREGYFVKSDGGTFGGRYLRYVVIDEFGSVEETRIHHRWDDAAMTKEEAVIHHLTANGALARAEADLERRRREAPEEQPEPEAPPMDEATRKFFSG